MSEVKIEAFIKAINSQFFDDFINKGQICLNTVKWFRDHEDENQNVGDSYEGVEMACAKGITVSLADPIVSYISDDDLKSQIDKADWKEFGKDVHDFKVFNTLYDANIFSLYAIKSNTYDGSIEEHLIPQKFVEEFLDCRFVLICSPRLFIEKLTKSLRKRGLPVKHGFVRYYEFDEKLRKDLTCFHKKDKYAYQKEFRLVSENINASRLVLNIGSLKHICFEIFPQKQMYKITNDEVELIIRMEDIKNNEA